MIKVSLTKDSTEEEVEMILTNIRYGVSNKRYLVDLLSERHPVYIERPTYQLIRIKGYAIASFLEVGLPDSAINFILEELQNGKNAYIVGAAARGLRGANQLKTEYVNFLIQAIYNLKYHDDSFDLLVYKPEWPLKNPSNGRLEIFRTLQWLRGYAKGALPDLRSFLNNKEDFTPEIRDEIRRTIQTIEEDQRDIDLSCCEIENKGTSNISWLRKGMRNIGNIANLIVQNEDGLKQSLAEAIGEKPTVVTFFYTKCINPNKCTLTINKLGWLQRELRKRKIEHKINLLAFTYDPNYDTPAKMRIYGENRGIEFGENTHVLRTLPEEFKVVSDFFQLGVNHIASTVNQHRLELFILNQKGAVETTYTRLQWEVANVVSDLVKLIESSSKRKWKSKIANTIQQVVFPVLIVFFPKCPFCWAAYLSVFGISALHSIPFSPWLLPVIFGVMLFNLLLLYRKAKVRNGLFPFWVSVTGTMLVSIGYYITEKPISFLGIGLIFIGAILNSLSLSNWSKIAYFGDSILTKFKGRFSFKINND